MFLALLLAAVAFASFSPALRGDFVAWDDNINIYENPHIQTLDAAHWRWMLTNETYMRRYQPLVWINYALLHHFWGFNPFPFHLEDLLFHAANTFLLFWLIRRLLLLAFKPAENSVSVLVSAAMATLFWAVHPLRAETVSWASGDNYSQCVMFALAALLAYLHAMSNGVEMPAWKTFPYWLAIVLFALSLLTYPVVIAFLAVLLMLDIFLLRRVPLSLSKWWNDPVARRTLLEKLPFMLLTLVFAFIAKQAANTGQYSLWRTSYGLHVAVSQSFFIWAYYLWKPWVPIHVSPIYTTLVNFDPATWYFSVSAAGVLSLGWLGWVYRRKIPLLLALYVCHIALLVPMLGLTENPHYPSDRFDYCVGLLWPVFIAFGLFKYWENKPRRNAALIFLLGTLPVFAVMSFQQAKIWRNSATLFQAGIARLGHDPYRVNLYYRLAAYYERTGRADLAAEQYWTILNISPQSEEARKALTRLHQQGAVR